MMGSESTASNSQSSASGEAARQVTDPVKRPRCRKGRIILAIVLVLSGVATLITLYFALTSRSDPNLITDIWSDSEDDVNPEIGNSTNGNGTDTIGNGEDEVSFNDIAKNEDVFMHSSNHRYDAGIFRDDNYRTLESQPLSASLPVFDRSSITGYRDCKDLKDGLYNAASIIANGAIMSHFNTKDNYYTSPEISTDENNFDDPFVYGDYSDTNSYLEVIDKADIVKSTHDYVFAAYGDQLVIWNATFGNMVSTTDMHSFHSFTNVLGNKRDVRIQSLLLHDDHLTVILTSRDMLSPETLRPIIHGVDGSTSILLYSISSIPSDGSSLVPLVTKDVEGTYKNAQVIDNILHVVTLSNVDTYNHLTRHFNREQERYNDLDDDEYIKNAAEYATNGILTSFVERLMDELAQDDFCRGVTKMSVFQTVSDPNMNVTVPHIDELMNGLARITTIDLPSDVNDETKTSPPLLLFLPSITGTIVYSSGRHILITARGYRHTANLNSSWRPHTYIRSFSLSTDGSRAEGRNFGMVAGHVINQNAMNIWDDHLRVASSIEHELVCSLQYDVNGCSWQLQLIPSSIHYITVLTTPTNDKGPFLHYIGSRAMEHVGFLHDIKNVGKDIGDVLFIGGRAYLTSVESLHFMDMSNHTSPAIKGKLDYQSISILHPLDDGNLLVIVGQNGKSADSSKLRISSYNITDLENSVLISDFRMEHDIRGQIQYNARASRFLPQSNLLLMPTSNKAQDESLAFDGFTIFDVSSSKISENFNISHVDPSKIQTSCWKDEYLPPRFFVHSEVVTTMKGHSVLAYNFTTRERLWYLNLDENSTDCETGGYWSKNELPQATEAIIGSQKPFR